MLGKKGKRFLRDSITWKEFILRGKGYGGTIHESFSPNRPFSIVYSSGTTGDSNGIILPHESYTSMAEMYKVSGIKLYPGMRFLHTIPFNHSTGQNNSFVMVHLLNGTVILDPPFSDKRFLNSIIKYKPDATIAPVTHYLPMLNADEKTKRKAKAVFDKLKLAYWVGEFAPDYYRYELNKILTYGIKDSSGECEVGPAITDSGIYLTKPQTAGKPLPGVNLAFFDPVTLEEKRYNEKGILWASTNARFNGYYNNIDKTLQVVGILEGLKIRKIDKSEFEKYSRSLDRSEIWVCLGDYGYMDSDGYVYYNGREYDAVNFSLSKNSQDDQKVDLFDIKKVIIGDSSRVIDCEVIDVPNCDCEKILLCQMILHPHYSLISENEYKNLIQYLVEICKSEFGEEFIPKGFKVISKFPQAISGKRDRECLKSDLCEYYTISKTGELRSFDICNNKVVYLEKH